MRDEDASAIRNLELFRQLGEDEYVRMMNASYLQAFPPGVRLIEEGTSADFLHVVVEGCVELFASANGRETTIDLLKPVSTFILAAVLKDAVHLMSARTTQQSRILLVPAQDVRAAMECDAEFSRANVTVLVQSFRTMVKAHKNQKLRTGVERLANYLLHQHTVQGSTGSIELPHDKRTLASLLGMTPENLSRAFATLAPYGVAVDGPTIGFTLLEDLERLAKSTPLIDDPST